MSAFWTEADFDDHELVQLVRDPATGLTAIIAVHSTHLGPGAGGTRFWHYADPGKAMHDALRLSRGMSYKNAMAGLPMGGGKAVVTVTGEDFPAVLPEAAIAAAVLLVPFAAFAAMVGLSWSLKSKGTIGSVIATVGIVGTATAFIGGCGLKITSEVSVLGPLLGSLSPVSLVWGLVYPEEAWEATVGSTGLTNARASMLIGCLIAAGIHVAIVYGLHAQMVRTFDFTVRKLAGTK